MYEATVEMLAAHGFTRYEVSNFARAGRACQHNLVYWRNESWWALGPSASGSIAGTRFKVVPRLGDWLARGAAEDDSAPVVDVEGPDLARNTSEALMLGLRLAEGVSGELERRAIALEPARAKVIARAIADGLLERDLAADRLRFTARGMILANEVLVQLV
jgi:oxygen-independent coproporphyrinogen-3 oxidase